MGRPRKDAFPEATVTRVIRAAEKAFGEKGYRNTRLADIAAEASITRPSLLYHFESKGNLYGQVVVKAFAELRAAALEGVGPNLNADTGLESLVANLVAFSQRRDSLVKVVLREIIDPSEKGTLVIQQEFASFLALVDATFRKIAGENLRQGLSTRSAIMHIVAGYLVKTAAGDLAETLWGPGEQTLEITRALLLQNA